MSNSTSIYITVVETPPMGCFPIAYKTFLSDAPDELAPKKLLPYHKKFIWEIKIKILKDVYNNNTMVRLSKTMPLKPCLKTIGTKIRYKKTLLRNVRLNWLKYGFEYWVSIHNP